MEKTGAPLGNPRHERYCQARASGKSQRAAMLEAFPSRASWKPESLDNAAYKLESRGEVKARLAALLEQAARMAAITRAEVLGGMARTFRLASEGEITQTKVSAVSSIGRTLLEQIPDAGEGPDEPFTADFGLLVAPPFLAPHRAVAEGSEHDLWLFGGRSSAKSSYVSLEIAAGVMADPHASAMCLMKTGKYLRESVYEQMLWALERLGVADQFATTVQPLRITRPATGQVIAFRGCDDPGKSKAIKAPAGTYWKFQWFEEADQFGGMAEIRKVQQSLTRKSGLAGEADEGFFRFYAFNPPRSRQAWANKEIEHRRQQGLPVHYSSYRDVPPEWIPAQLLADAEELRARDEESFRHEYLGEPVGWGTDVFPRAVVREVAPEQRASLDRHWYGVDWGFAQDPWVWVKVGYDRRARTLYVLDEMSGKGLDNAASAQMVIDRMAAPLVGADGQVLEPAEPWADVECDSAEPKSISDYISLGIRAHKAPKTGVHSVRDSVRWLQSRAAIVIDPRCSLAAREFTSYEYVVSRDGEVTGQVPDADNHAIDAVRYACATLIDDRGCV